MKENTQQMIMLALGSDPEATQAERDAVRALLEAFRRMTTQEEIVALRVTLENGHKLDQLTNPEPLDRVLKREEVARIFGFSTKAVDYYGRIGVLRRVQLGGKRSSGYSEQSVRDLLAGRKAGRKGVAA